MKYSGLNFFHFIQITALTKINSEPILVCFVQTEIHFGQNMLNYTNQMGLLNRNLSRSDELCGEQSKCTLTQIPVPIQITQPNIQ
jgi:hypothetical protein